MVNSEGKKCPICDGVIMAEAIKCKHCKADLTVVKTEATPIVPVKKEIVEIDLAFAKNDYNMIKEVSQELWFPDLPVVPLKCQLLRQGEDQGIYLGIVYSNVSQETIKSLYIQVNCFDDAGDPVDYDGSNSIKRAYMDLFVQPKKTFGNNELIKLTGPTVRNIDIVYEKIVFDSGEVLRFEGDLSKFSFPKLQMINELPTHLIELYKKVWIDDATHDYVPTYIPQKHDHNIWNCTCGQLNINEHENCNRCGRNMAEQFMKINLAYLESEYNRLVEVKQKESAEQKKRSMQIRKKMLQIAAILVVSIIIVSLATWGIGYAMDTSRYNNAFALLSSGKPLDAKAMFVELDDFKDSKVMVLEADYLMAENYLFEDQYEEAIELFTTLSELHDYKDSADRITECYYRYGTLLMNKNLHQEAVGAFSQALTYEDAESHYKSQHYYWAKQLLDEADKQKDSNRMVYMSLLSEALLIIDNADGYADSEEIVENMLDSLNEARYDEAVALYDKFYLLEAQEMFHSIDNYKSYKDVNEYLSSKYYEIVGKWNPMYNLVLKDPDTYIIYYLGSEGEVVKIASFGGSRDQFKFNLSWLPNGDIKGVTSPIRIVTANEDTLVLNEIEYNSKDTFKRISRDTEFEVLISKTGPMVGMTKEQVLNDTTWGRPNKINTTISGTSVREQWVYSNNKYLYFENGVLTSIQK